MPEPASTLSLRFLHFPAVPSVKTAEHRSPAGPVPQVYSYEHLALFCKLEVKMERAFGMPVKFRLGDVEYVDWLEGKRYTSYGQTSDRR